MRELYYDKYVEELNKLYETDPQGAVNYLADSLSRVRYEKSLKVRLGFDDEKLNIVITIILALLTLPVALICNGDPSVVVFGIIFYLAGIMIGLFVPYAGIIFLFSHGGTGFFFLIQDVTELLKSNPIMSDLSSSMTNHIYLAILINGLAVVLTILQSFIPSIRKIKYIKSIIMFLFLVGLLVVRMIPYSFGVSPIFPFLD